MRRISSSHWLRGFPSALVDWVVGSGGRAAGGSVPKSCDFPAGPGHVVHPRSAEGLGKLTVFPVSGRLQATADELAEQPDFLVHDGVFFPEFPPLKRNRGRLERRHLLTSFRTGNERVQRAMGHEDGP